MKGLVAAGGLGSRLRPLTHTVPKQLLPVAGVPVVVHALNRLRDIGITEIALVVGEFGAQTEQALGDGSGLGLRLTYLPQDRPRGIAHCVSLARDFLGGDDFVLFLGDNVFPGGLADYATAFRAKRPAAQIVVHKVSDPRAFGVAELDPDGRVTRIVEKPAEPRSDLAVIGAYFCTPALHEAVAAISPSARGELEITDALQWLVSRGDTVHAQVHTGYWKDTGTIEDLLDCNRELLDHLEPGVDGEVDAASELTGPVRIAPGARVVRSRIQGPVTIGAGTTVLDSRIGPHTAIGRQCSVSASGVGTSILLDGAHVHGVPDVRASVIGQHARVDRRSGPPGQRLVLGDHARAEIAG
ncbi:glucose-1-phosphate thymidylyltransferase [Streptomyces sp. rh34]|uniref:glucose-1-phosphate thymidylyltransferase n=1 Tax=Streptomyces sp. rh34 TaxID=2034272 RepID=UPI000BF01F6D|nr:glucose-1-phosphate thymidylyltransferase [Streptomyces sp. rh34]